MLVLGALVVGFRARAQEYPFAPGVLDRIQVVIETSGGKVPGKTTNTLAPTTTSLDIVDSTYPLTGQSVKIQFEGQPPVQPRLDGALKFNFPTVTPARDVSGVFQPSMPAAVSFDGTWTKADLNYAAGEGYSYSAARIILGSIQPTGCPNTATSTVKTGAPIPVGVNPVAVSANCDLRSLNSLGGGSSLEVEQFASGVLSIQAGDGGVGDNPIFATIYSQVIYYAVYKSRRRPEIAIARNTLNFLHTDGQPLPPPVVLTLTNTGGLPLNWTATAVTTPPGGSWLKLDPAGGTLESLGEQPLAVSVDPTGLAPGSYSATVTVAGNTWNGSKTFNVTFKFTGTPKLTITPTALEFFNRVALPEQTLTMKNEGSARLVWKATATSTNNWLRPDFGSDEILPGQTKEFRVRALASPPLEPGDHPGQIVFEPYPGNPASFDFPPVTVTGVFHVLPPSDDLAILPGTVAPSTNDLIQLDTEYSTFRADVTYQLGTRTDADLALRLFDEEGNLQASSDFVRVFKSDGKVSSRTLTIPKFKLVADGQGRTPEKLVLRAVLIDRSLLTPIKYTPDTDYVFTVKPPVALKLGEGTTPENFVPRSYLTLPAYSGRLESGEGWPTAAQVELARSPSPRFVTVTARLFRQGGPSKFYTAFRTTVPGNFEGRVVIDFTEKGFLNLPDECLKERADFVQFRANVLVLDALTVVESPQVDLPVERIQVVAVDPPFGTVFPRTAPAKIKVTVEYNVPDFGQRQIRRAVVADSATARCVLNDDPLVFEGELGPGRGQLEREVTVDVAQLPEKTTVFSLSHLLLEPGGSLRARECGYRQEFVLSDELVIPPAPATVAAADASLQVVTHPNAHTVSLSVTQKSLQAAGDDPGPVFGAGAAAGRAAVRRNALLFGEVQNVISVNRVWHFQPRIPTGFGFGARLTLTYAPDFLPDDPNFVLTNLKVISYDPAIGMRTYETTLDPATRTASALIDSLDAYYTLGVVGPFARRVVNLPLLQAPPGLTARLGVDIGDTATTSILTAFDSVGQVIAGDGVTNPVSSTLGLDTSRMRPVGEVFSLSSSLTEGWVQAVTDRDADMLLLLEGAGVADALPSLEAFPRLLLPTLEHDTNRTTELRFANPTRFENPVTFELHDNAGATVGTFTRVLGPRHTLARSLTDLFPAVTAGFSGYLIARGENNLVGAALVRSGAALAVVAGQPLVSRSLPRLVAPGVVTGGTQWRSRLSLVNPGLGVRPITLRLVGSDGTDLAPSIKVELSGGQRYSAELGQLFKLGTAGPVTGSLVVETAGGDETGEWTQYDAATDAFRASQPLLSMPATRWSFPYLDHAEGRATEFSVFNPGNVPTRVTGTVFLADGSRFDTLPFIVAAGAGVTQSVPGLIFPGGNPVGDTFTITSEQEVYVSAVGTGDPPVALTAIPGRIFETLAPPTLYFSNGGLQLNLFWDALPTGFTLQSSPALGAAAVWSDVDVVPLPDEGGKSVSVQFSETPRFFRLARKP